MNREPDIIDALISIRPDSNFSVEDQNDLSTITWDENTEPPTEDEITNELERLKAEYEAQNYARNRAANYPPIGDQLDALYHAGVFPEEMASKIAAVKEQFPKPDQA